MKNYNVTQNRDKLPGVISRRLEQVHEAAKSSTNPASLERKLRKAFEKTKVQVGELWFGNHKKFFIRNGFRGKAHLIVHR